MFLFLFTDDSVEHPSLNINMSITTTFIILKCFGVMCFHESRRQICVLRCYTYIISEVFFSRVIGFVSWMHLTLSVALS